MQRMQQYTEKPQKAFVRGADSTPFIARAHYLMRQASDLLGWSPVMPGVMQFFSKLRDMSLRLYAESIKREAAFLEAYRVGVNDLQAEIHLPPTEDGWLKAAFVELAELASGMNDEKQGGEGPARVPGLGGWTKDTSE